MISLNISPEETYRYYLQAVLQDRWNSQLYTNAKFIHQTGEFCDRKSGYKEEDIVLYLEPIIHAVECIELLQKLTEFGCMTRHVQQYRKYYSPFDKKGRLHSYAYYMPTIDCLNRLSLLTSALQKDV
ncbi:hypothetical protein BSL78_13327 [Apostichopus japonicus]|uniref:Uncharacterized protein n=1 Tax=Stichopus japonicus TaxID=307972 RepID=A0A2G8KPD2_STIJA|nr:hypothetical protein BSL78_13327 [Apostichopus japonicus]